MPLNDANWSNYLKVSTLCIKPYSIINHFYEKTVLNIICIRLSADEFWKLKPAAFKNWHYSVFFTGLKVHVYSRKIWNLEVLIRSTCYMKTMWKREKRLWNNFSFKQVFCCRGVSRHTHLHSYFWIMWTLKLALTLYHLQMHFDASKAVNFWKHCNKIAHEHLHLLPQYFLLHIIIIFSFYRISIFLPRPFQSLLLQFCCMWKRVNNGKN